MQKLRQQHDQSQNQEKGYSATQMTPAINAVWEEVTLLTCYGFCSARIGTKQD